MNAFRPPGNAAMTQQLLTPVRLGALELRNRVIMAPLMRCRTDNPGYVPTAMTARYYAQRASAGLIISEGTIVSPQARGYPFTPGIWSAEQVADGMSTVALFAVMMRRCRPEHEGADFTLQASAQVLLAGLVGATSGVLAQTVGYVPLFLLAGALGLAALALLRYGIPPQERRAAER